MFKRVSKLRTNKITGGVLLNQKMAPQMLSTEENRQKATAIKGRLSHAVPPLFIQLLYTPQTF